MNVKPAQPNIQVDEVIFNCYKLVNELLQAQFKQLRHLSQAPLTEQIIDDDGISKSLAQSLIVKEEELLTHFLNCLQTSFGSLSEKPEITSTVSKGSSGLSLVDYDELQQQLNIEKIAKSIFQANQTDFSEFNMRLESLLKLDIPLIKNPLHPLKCCHSFKSAIKSLGLDSAEETPSLNFFLDSLNQHYANLLKESNNFLTQKGILEEIEENDRLYRYEEENRREATKDKRKEILSELTEGNPDNAISNESVNNKISELVESVESDERFKSHYIESSKESAEITNEILLEEIKALSDIPEINLKEKGYPDTTDTEPSIAEKISKIIDGEKHHLSDQASNMVSMMSMLFKEINEDNNLAPLMRYLIGYLQGPVLTVAIKDKNFFSDMDNPAQKLLDSIAHAGSTWNKPADRHRDALFNKMATLIYDLNQQEIIDYSAFEKCQADFDIFMKGEKRRARLIEQKMVATEKAKARTENARLVAARHSARLLKVGESHSTTIPKGIVSFIGSAWNQVLFYIHNLNDSTDCEAWQEAVDLEQRFLNLLIDFDETQINPLLDDISNQLQSVGMPSNEIERWVSELAEVFLSMPIHQANQESSPTKQEEKAEPLETIIEFDQSDELPELESLDKYEAMADNLTPNAWVESRVNNEIIKVRVASIIKHTNKVVLVNRNGTKSELLTKKDLAKKLRDGDMTIVDNGMFFDRALENVIESMRR